MDPRRNRESAPDGGGLIDPSLAGEILAAQRKTDTFKCSRCGKVFVARILHGKYADRRRFCSEACNQLARGPRKPKGERVSEDGQSS